MMLHFGVRPVTAAGTLLPAGGQLGGVGSGTNSFLEPWKGGGMEVAAAIVIAALIVALVIVLRNQSSVKFVEVRPGKRGRFRWVGIDANERVRVVPTVPGGWSQPGEAEKEGLAVFPRATTRRRLQP